MKKLLLHSSLLMAVICIGPMTLIAQTTLRSSASPHTSKLIASIELDPEKQSLHEEYYDLASRDGNSVTQYEKLAVKHPKSPMIHFYLGKLYSRTDLLKAQKAYEKSAALNPASADAWNNLYFIALANNEDSLARVYSYQATKASPKNAKFALQHASSYQGYDQIRYDSLSLDILRRFPESEEAARALIMLHDDTKDPVLKRIYLEQSRKLFEAHPTAAGGSAAARYYNTTLFTQPETALSIALDMVRTTKLSLLAWKHKAESAKTMFTVNSLLKENKTREAIELYKSIRVHNTFANSTLPKDQYRDYEVKLYALNGEIRRAFDTVALDYSKWPSKKLQHDLMKYGIQLGMDSNKVIDHIWAMRDKTSEIADPFTLLNLRTNQQVPMTDFKGKIILLTHWFPLCGPCRAEFPQFENIARKFSDQIAYIGVNGMPEEIPMVIPFLDKRKISFIPLTKVKPEFLGNLNTNSYPTNFIIDPQGKIIFRDFRADVAEDEENLEIMIKEILERKPQG